MCDIGGHYLKYKRMCACIYMEIDVLSTLAYESKKDKKGNPPAQTNKHIRQWTPGCPALRTGAVG